jgi:8-oxo-dGTP pyrophosphatase MutT (NUDIX family)
MTEPRSQEPLAANNRPAEHVRAAGGVVVRVEASGRQEILLVHRRQYGDWTLPKGKARDGETDEACALREVEEETGLRCTLVRELASSEYIDRKKRPKVVR